VAKTVADFGGVDVLVNNSGGLIARKTFAEMSLEHWNNVMSLNLTSTFLMIKAVGPHMMIDTDFHNIHTPDAGRRGFEAAAPLKRQGVSEDVANLVLFLACDDSAFITGTNVDINGGMLFS